MLIRNDLPESEYSDDSDDEEEVPLLYATEHHDHEDTGSEDDGHPSDLVDIEALEHGSDVASPLSEHHVSDFPQFTRLPLELRLRIWEEFCPDLTVNARLFEFRIDPTLHTHNGYTVWDGPQLEDQTGDARRVLAVHQESRDYALTKLPDSLSFQDGAAAIRFNKQNDLILISGNPDPPAEVESTKAKLSGFADQIMHLGLPVQTRPKYTPEEFEPFFHLFPRLQAVYMNEPARNFLPDDLRWCTTNVTNRYCLEFSEELEDGRFRELETTYAWPRVSMVDPQDESIRESRVAVAPRTDPDVDPTRPDIKFWPLLDFPDSDLWRLWSLFQQGDERPVVILDWGALSSEEASVGDYESSGIDDEEQDSDDPDESDDDLAVQPLSDAPINDEEQQSDGPDESEDDSAVQPLSAAPINEATSQPSSPARSGTSSQESETQEPAAGRRAKRQVLSSDDDDDGDDEGGHPSASSNKRARIAPLSADEESDGGVEEPSAKPGTTSGDRKRDASSPELDDSENDSAVDYGYDVREDSDPEESDGLPRSDDEDGYNNDDNDDGIPGDGAMDFDEMANEEDGEEHS